MTKIADLHAKWMEKPTYKAEYDALEEEFALMAALLKARTQAPHSKTGSRAHGNITSRHCTT